MPRPQQSSLHAPGRRHRAARALTVALAIAAAVVGWMAATQAFGIEVRSPEMGGEPPADITLMHVVAASTVASVAAWAPLAVLERLTSRARPIWFVAALTVLVLSLGAPLTGAGITGANQAVLAALHVTVAAVLIPGMLRASGESQAERWLHEVLHEVTDGEGSAP